MSIQKSSRILSAAAVVTSMIAVGALAAPAFAQTGHTEQTERAEPGQQAEGPEQAERD